MKWNRQDEIDRAGQDKMRFGWSGVEQEPQHNVVHVHVHVHVLYCTTYCTCASSLSSSFVQIGVLGANPWSVRKCYFTCIIGCPDLFNRSIDLDEFLDLDSACRFSSFSLTPSNSHYCIHHFQVIICFSYLTFVVFSFSFCFPFLPFSSPHPPNRNIYQHHCSVEYHACQ